MTDLISPNLYIGLMSGTSLDGADGVLVNIPDDYNGGFLKTLSFAHIPFSADLRYSLIALQSSSENEIEREAAAANYLAQIYATAVSELLDKSGVKREQVRAIGVHGQTIRHRPDLKFTRQTNNPALLAELCGIDVIADFRSRDIAAGGQGAPLVPAFHKAVFASENETRVVVNIGGIANISILEKGRVSGFDTGAGNVLMDAWCTRNIGKNFDVNGQWAKSGKVNQTFFEVLMREPYLKQSPPKSTGRDLFNSDWLDEKLKEAEKISGAALSAQDVQATLLEYTAQTITDAIADYAPKTQAVFVCGGGAYNSQLMKVLKEKTEKTVSCKRVFTTEELGVASNQVESLAFAWLAHRFCVRKHGNVPEVTGANGGRILGALYPA